MKRNESDTYRGSEGFDRFYAQRFGARWRGLRTALMQESSPVEWRAGALPYYLDSASILAAAALPLAGAHSILDMCAAPGGKSLVIAALMGADARLTCNERSVARFGRLRSNLDECLTRDVRCRVRATSGDAALLCQDADNAERFDRILLDAPCSSERHVIKDAKYLSQWSPHRIKSLAIAQWALVSSAWRCLARGGYLLYSTCALCREENDGIIKRLLGKMSDAVIVADGAALNDAARRIKEHCAAVVDAEYVECTEYGCAVMPDSGGNMGPIYFALIAKKAA